MSFDKLFLCFMSGLITGMGIGALGMFFYLLILGMFWQAIVCLVLSGVLHFVGSMFTKKEKEDRLI